jgi:hypothetical protein
MGENELRCHFRVMSCGWSSGNETYTLNVCLISLSLSWRGRLAFLRLKSSCLDIIITTINQKGTGHSPVQTGGAFISLRIALVVEKKFLTKT